MNDFLIHFGIPGQRWGVRRFQNEDGTLTEEGRQRYLDLNNDSIRLYNEVADRMNKDLARINKKYDNVDLNDDRNNLEYSKEVRDMWQKNYRDVLAKDLGTDPSSLSGQKWLDDVFGYKSGMDEEIEELETKVRRKELTENSRKSTQKTDNGNDMVNIKTSFEAYGEKQKHDLKKAYSDSEIKRGSAYYMSLFKKAGVFKSNPELFAKLNKMPEDEQFYYLLNMVEAISG